MTGRWPHAFVAVVLPFKMDIAIPKLFSNCGNPVKRCQRYAVSSILWCCGEEMRGVLIELHPPPNKIYMHTLSSQQVKLRHQECPVSGKYGRACCPRMF